MVALISFTIAGFFTFMTSSLISSKNLFGIRMVRNAVDNVLFIVFVGIFLLAALMMVSSLLRTTSIKERHRAPKAKNQQAGTRKVTKVRKKKRKRRPKPDGDEDAMRKNYDAKEDDDVNDRLREEMGGKTSNEAGTVPPADNAASSSGLSPKEEKQKTFMMKALGTALEGSKFNKEKLDNFNKFGVNLWVAGATEALVQSRSIDQAAANKFLGDSVQVLGY